MTPKTPNMGKNMVKRRTAIAESASVLTETIRRLPQEYERGVALASLGDWPKNPKDHDIGAIIASIEATGWYGVVYAQRSTRRLLAGHGRKDALLQLGVRVADVLWIECSDREGARIVAADNRLVELGGYRDDMLLDFLREMQADGNLAGTGFDDDDVVTLQARIDGQQLDDANNDDDGDSATSGPTVPTFLAYARDRIVDEAFRHFRMTGFPYRALTLHEQMQEINKLAALCDAGDDALLQTTLGYQVADTYHPHRFAASAEGQRSPLESFAIDSSLRHALTMQLDNGGRVGRELWSTMLIAHGTQACANFRPGVAAYFYRRYAPTGARVLDPCAGYGGRLVGWIASRIGGSYTGVDPNTLTQEANRSLARALDVGDRVTLINAPFEDVSRDDVRALLGANAYDFAFTSPPYFTKEHYSDDDTQSWVRYPTIDEWVAGFLVPLVQGAYRALKNGAHCVINIADVKLRGDVVPLQSLALDMARDAGFQHVETLPLTLQTRAGRGEQLDPIEPMLVFRKIAGGPNGNRALASSDTRQRATSTEQQHVAARAGINEAALLGAAHVPIVKQYDDIFVVRDDVLMGGTKMRYCAPLCHAREHVVYASAAQGGAQLALAYAARAAGHRATIFVAKRRELHPRTIEAQSVGAQIIQVSPGYLAVVQKRAREYAAEHGAFLVEFGGESAEAQSIIAAAASNVAARYGPFAEVWCAVGSGVLIRALQAGIAGADFYGLAVGRDVPQADVGAARVTRAAVPFEQREKREPPFPSCPNYDAKAWWACFEHYRRTTSVERPQARVLFWNVLGPSPTPFGPVWGKTLAGGEQQQQASQAGDNSSPPAEDARP